MNIEMAKVLAEYVKAVLDYDKAYAAYRDALLVRDRAREAYKKALEQGGWLSVERTTQTAQGISA